MAFSPGDHVHIAALGKGVVREVRNGGRYLVEVKGRSVVVDGGHLSVVEQGRRRGKSSGGAPQASTPEDPARAHAPAWLDLHGLTALDAVAALDSFLNDAILAGLTEVRVIHGRSGAILKNAVHARLRVLPAVRHFRVDPANSGVTIVEL